MRNMFLKNYDTILKESSILRLKRVLPNSDYSDYSESSEVFSEVVKGEASLFES